MRAGSLAHRAPRRRRLGWLFFRRQAHQPCAAARLAPFLSRTLHTRTRTHLRRPTQVSSGKVEEAVAKAKAGHYQLACAAAWEGKHGCSCESGINHPNQVGAMSRRRASRCACIDVLACQGRLVDARRFVR